MAQVSPPKPWERAGSGRAAAQTLSAPHSTAQPQGSTLPLPSTQPTTLSPSTATTTSSAPAIPQRPSALSSVVNQTASAYTNPAQNSYGMGATGYGMGSSYSSPYSSPYSRLGGMGSMGSMYGSMGGSMYGGGMYGGGMGGMYGGGGMYGQHGMYGQSGGNGDPNGSMTNNFAQSTQATFQIIESIVGAFGGFAQMLESTYMATHSSFFAMVSVAEQFGNLRQTLGSVLGIYTVLRWLRTIFARVTGRLPPADATSLTPSNFFAFSGVPDPTSPHGAQKPPRPSKKPFIVFLLAVFGLPYLMGKFIKALARNQEEQLQQQQQQQQGQVQYGPDGQPLPPQPRPGLDPSKLDFCRVLYDFPPPEAIANGSFDQGLDLEVKKGDLVAVLDKSEPSAQGGAGAEGSWWRCRARDGRMGWLPAVYLETIQKRPQQPQQAQIKEKAESSNGGSRANTMPSSVTSAGAGVGVGKADNVYGNGTHSRAQTMGSSVSAGSGTASSLKQSTGGGVEGFQKAWVNDR